MNRRERRTSAGPSPIVWIDCRNASLADVRPDTGALVIVPVAWHRRAELVTFVARKIPEGVSMRVEADAEDRLVWAAVRAARRFARIHCLVWHNIAQ